MTRDELLAALSDENIEDFGKAISEACHIVWQHKSVDPPCPNCRAHFWSIPVDERRDVDCRLRRMWQALRAAKALLVAKETP